MPTLKGINKYTPAQVKAVEMGQLGFDVIADGDGAVTGNWWKIRFAGNVTLGAGAIVSGVGDNPPAASYTKGDELVGNFVEINNDNGATNAEIIAYRY